MSLCDKCISGVRHKGVPEGQVEVINGINTYVATPTGDYSKDKAVLYLSDVFGIEFINAQLLADDFARNGFKTYAIDYLNKDPIPPEALGYPGSTFDLQGWLKKHGPEMTRPALDAVIAGLKERGVTQFAATGYCFGGRYTFDLAFENIIKVAAVAHPSFLDVPKDLEKYKETGIPLLINSCDDDFLFPEEAQKQADEILGEGTRTGNLYRREHFEGCEHGFAVRGDMSNPKVKAGKEGAFKATIEHFLKYL